MNTKRPFEAVVTQHSQVVLRVCRALVGPHDADDAWSDTFLSALRAYPDLPAEANIEAWLVTIAHRKAIDIHRARARRAIPVDEVPEPTTTSATSAASATGAEQELWDAVKTLPSKQRQAVAYHYIAGLPYADVATILGGTTDAARRAAADGIAKLRTLYHGASWKEGTR